MWRTKKFYFRPSDEMSMKNVDKDAVNTNKAFLLATMVWTGLEPKRGRDAPDAIVVFVVQKKRNDISDHVTWS